MHALAGSSSQKQIGHVIADRGRVQWSPDEEVGKEEPASAGAVEDEPARRSSRRCRVLLREAVSSSSTSSLSTSEMTSARRFRSAIARVTKRNKFAREQTQVNKLLLLRATRTGMSLAKLPLTLAKLPLPGAERQPPCACVPPASRATLPPLWLVRLRATRLRGAHGDRLPMLSVVPCLLRLR